MAQCFNLSDRCFCFFDVMAVGVEDSEDRKKLYFLIQRLQTVSFDGSMPQWMMLLLMGLGTFLADFDQQK